MEKLRATITKLEREKEELQSKFNKATRENMVLKRKNNQIKDMLDKSRKKKKVERDLKEIILKCLNQADSGLGSLHDQLDRAKTNGREWKCWWNLTTEQKKEVRERLEAQNQELKEKLWNSKHKWNMNVTQGTSLESLSSMSQGLERKV